MNNVTGAVNHVQEQQARQQAQQGSGQTGELKRWSCHVPKDQVEKRWTEHWNLGMGPCPIEHTITKDGEHIVKICSLAMCIAEDDKGNRQCASNMVGSLC